MRLSVEGLRVARGERLVLDGVAFVAGPGAAILVTGPNGAGKSTLLRTVAGLIGPLAGRVTLTGGDPEAAPAESMHLVGHRDGIKDALLVAENLAFAGRFLGSPRPDTGKALDRVGLGPLADLPAGILSAGQRRRLALARLIAAPRPVWLLDEPQTALDRAGQAVLDDLVAEHRGGGGIVIAATHAPLGWADARELALQPVRGHLP